MRGLTDDPKSLQWLIALLIGIPVAAVLAAAFPDRQGTQFVPFLIAGAVSFSVVFLVSVLISRWWIARREAREDAARRRAHGGPPDT